MKKETVRVVNGIAYYKSELLKCKKALAKAEADLKDLQYAIHSFAVEYGEDPEPPHHCPIVDDDYL